MESSLLPLQRSRLHAFPRLDVHEHVRDAFVTFLHRTLHSMRDAVAFAHGNIAVHADVKIDIKLQAHFTDAWFFNCLYAIDGTRGPLYHIDNFSARRCVHDLSQCRPQQACAISRDYRTSKQRSPIICATPFCAADKRDGNADECSCRNDRVDAMMQGVGFDGGAIDITAEAIHVTEPDFFHSVTRPQARDVAEKVRVR